MENAILVVERNSTRRAVKLATKEAKRVEINEILIREEIVLVGEPWSKLTSEREKTISTTVLIQIEKVYNLENSSLVSYY